jgi:hypothetical protein
MLTRSEVEQRRRQSIELFAKAGMVITDEEKGRIEIADFGLSRF